MDQSKTANVIDVATPANRKLKALGIVWITCALALLAIISLVLYTILTSKGLNNRGIIAAVSFVPFAYLLWGSLATAMHRFSAAAMSGRYFRVNPNGISVCLAKADTKAIYLFRHGKQEIELPWNTITKWYSYTHSVNGIPVKKTIRFHTARGARIDVYTYNFAESQRAIIENIKGAASRLKRPEDVIIRLPRL